MLGRFRSIGFAGTLVALFGTSGAFCSSWSGLHGDLARHKDRGYADSSSSPAICGFLGAIVIFRFPVSPSARAAAREAPRITWRKEYRLYYWLTFLDGSRQQIYFAFAPFVLVEQFEVDALTLTALLIVSALINWQAGADVGKMVDRYGEKRMLTIGYCLHLLVFLGFALSQNIWLLYLSYLGYNFLFLFSIGTTTYLRKICRPRGSGAEPGDGRLAGSLDRHRGADRRRRALAAARLPVSLPLRHRLHLHLAVADAEDRHPQPAHRRRSASGGMRHEAEEEMAADAAPLPYDSGPVVSPGATLALSREDGER